MAPMSRVTPADGVRGDPIAVAPLVTVVDLPTPPSVNATRRIDWRSMAKFTAWQRAADALVMTQKPLRNIGGQFELSIVVSEDVRKDLDNIVKSTCDYLKRIELIIDDSPKYFRKLTVEWGDAPEGVRVTLTAL